MTWDVKSRLQAGDSPADFYELLGKQRFDPDLKAISKAIRDANRELMLLQNHSDAAIASRAIKWQMELGRAADKVRNLKKLAAYHAELLRQIFAAYAERSGPKAGIVNESELRSWLAIAENVHPSLLDLLIRHLTRGSLDNCARELAAGYQGVPLIAAGGLKQPPPLSAEVNGAETAFSADRRQQDRAVPNRPTVVNAQTTTNSAPEARPREWPQIVSRWGSAVWRPAASVDRILGSLVGNDSRLLHNILRVTVALVLFIVPAWALLTRESDGPQRAKIQEQQRVLAELERLSRPARLAESRSRAAEAAARALLTTSLEPRCYTEGQRQLDDASAALEEDRFADAQRLFDEATGRFVQAQREAPLVDNLEKLRRQWTTTLESADEELLVTHAPSQLALAKRQAATAEEQTAVGDFALAMDQYRVALNAIKQAQAESEAMEILTTKLDETLAKKNAIGAADLVAEIEKLYPHDPRLPSWKNQVASLRQALDAARNESSSSETGGKGIDPKRDPGVKSKLVSDSFPSGNRFSPSIFEVATETIGKEGVKNGDNIVKVKLPTGSQFAVANHVKGRLNGVFTSWYAQERPMVYANYFQNKRDGLLKAWDEAGSPVLFTQYTKGKRNGFSCFFKDGRLQMLIEYRSDDVNGIRLVSGEHVTEEFATQAKVPEDSVAQRLLNDLALTEKMLLTNENKFKRQVLLAYEAVVDAKKRAAAPALKLAKDEKRRTAMRRAVEDATRQNEQQRQINRRVFGPSFFP